MGYTIKYLPTQKVRNRTFFYRRMFLTLLFFTFFLILVNKSWPEGRAAAGQVIGLLGETGLFRELEVFAEELDHGTSIFDTIVSFFGL